MNSCIRLILLSVMLSTSCANGDRLAADSMSDELTADVFEHRSNCINAWRKVLSQWESSGGGIKESIAETRDFIAKDKSSSFSRFVRAAWDRQKTEVARPIGAWPISEEARLEVEASMDYSLLNIPTSCQTSVWLDEQLQDAMITDADFRRLSDTPSNMPWDSPYISHWIGYWLFAKHCGQPCSATKPGRMEKFL